MTQNPNSPQYTPDAPQWIAGSQPPPEQHSAAQPPAAAKGRWRSPDGKPTGLALAGAGSLLAVLAFLGGTAVGHASAGTSSPTDQTQFGGPGGGRFPQLPGQQGGTGQGRGQGANPNQQPSTGTQGS